MAERACGYIEQQAETKTPFLLYLPLTSPHTPLSVNKQWIGRSKLNLYADFVMETDTAVGKVLSSIKECGLEKETLVIFTTSDNGYAPYIGVTDLESKGHYPSGELRGYKADAWEGGHRVPFIVRWNGVLRRIDLQPTGTPSGPVSNPRRPHGYSSSRQRRRRQRKPNPALARRDESN